MLPVADGSDRAVSLENACAFNDVLGFRPSAGRTLLETQQLLAPTFAARGLMARSVRDLGRLFLVQSGYNDLGACAMREDLRRDAKPGRRVFQDSRVAWFGDLGGQLAEPSWSVNHRDDAPTLAALRQVTGAVPRCHAGALPSTQSRPAIGFRYDPSLDLVAPTAPMPHPDPGYRSRGPETSTKLVDQAGGAVARRASRHQRLGYPPG
jgi:Amidase